MWWIAGLKQQCAPKETTAGASFILIFWLAVGGSSHGPVLHGVSDRRKMVNPLQEVRYWWIPVLYMYWQYLY